MILVLFSLVATMKLTDNELISFFKHVERLVDQLDVVHVVRLVALVGERLLVILPEEQGVRAGHNDVDTFR